MWLEDIDENLVGVLEPDLIGVDSVESIKSISRDGRMRISINFETGADMGKAMQDVKDALDQAQNLPENVEEIKVTRRQWRDRVTNAVISGPVPLEQLSRFADEFSQGLYRLGVSKTTISGVTAPILRVSVPEFSMVEHDLSLQEIANAIKSEAEANPSGDLGQTANRITTGSSKRRVEDIENIVVRSTASGAKLLVSDIAELKIEGLSRGTAFFRQDNPAIFIL